MSEECSGSALKTCADQAIGAADRAMWGTTVWLDDHYTGMQDSLCVPHRLDLSDYLTACPHRLTLRIDKA